MQGTHAGNASGNRTAGLADAGTVIGVVYSLMQVRLTTQM